MMIITLMSYLISPLSGFSPLGSTDVVADVVIGATVDEYLPALVENDPGRGGVLLHPVTQEL